MRAGHFEFTVHHGECQPAFDQIERVLTELFEAPAGEDLEVFAVARRQTFQFFGTSNQARSDIDFARPDFEQ